MQFAMILQDARVGIAAAIGGRLHAIFKGQAAYPGDIDDLVAAGARDLRPVHERLVAAPALAAGDVTFLPPLRRPGKIICVGLNYHEHTAESKMAQPDYPVLFSRFSSNIVAHNGKIMLPRVSHQLDYEGELVAIIGRTGKHILKENAINHVVGYSIFNDVSVRDYQFRTHQWTIGKNFDATGAFGPYFVAAESLPPGGRALALTTKLNGEIVQSASTDAMIHDVAALVSLISEGLTLEPGDLIVTGTPSGVGVARTPPIFMKAGDRISVEIEGIGELSNIVSAE